MTNSRSTGVGRILTVPRRYRTGAVGVIGKLRIDVKVWKATSLEIRI